MRNLKWILIGSLVTLTACVSSPTRYGAVERLNPDALANITPVSVANLSLADIVLLSKQGNSADNIIAQIKASNAVYDLTPGQTLDLSKQGVDTRVLNYIYTSNQLAKQNATAEQITQLARANQMSNQQMQLQNQMVNSYYGGWPLYSTGYPTFYGGYSAGFGSRRGFRPNFSIGIGQGWAW